MICATLLTLGFVSTANVYSEETYIVDTVNSAAPSQAMDCSINTAKVDADSKFYWDASNEQLSQWLARFNIVANLDQLDNLKVDQQYIAEDDLP